jgi:tetratricopeptide (TPR) repeat protein
VGLGRIVVAPFLNATENKSVDLVGLMAGDWLTEGLQKTGILDVAPTSGVFEIDSLTRRARAPTRALAEETGAGTVVTGAYYLRRDSLLFRLQVVDQGGRRVVGTITDVAAPVSDPISGVEELRNRLMGWLAMHYDERLQVPAAGAERPPTYEAYRAFSEGMTLYIATQNARALPLFLEAYRRDTSFVPALLYATLSLTNVEEWQRADSLLQIVELRRNALSPYDRALLDYRLGVIRGNGELALSATRTAARLAPASKAVYNHAVVAFQNGYIHEALSTIESIEPDRGAMRGFASYWSIYGSIVHALGDYDREHGVGVAAREAYPQRLMAFPPVLRALAAKGRLAEIDETLRLARSLPPDPYYYWDYGALLIETGEELRAHGHPNEAAKYFTELRDWAAARDSVPRMKWRVVQAFYALGRWSEAASALSTLRLADPQNVDYVGMTGLLAARMGQRASAMLVADSLAQRRKRYELGIPSLYRARIAATLGDRDLAVEALRQAFAEERPFQVWVHRDLDLEPLHGYPAFERILRGKD